MSELPAAHRSHSLGLPDKHFRKSFQKTDLDIHYLSQPCRAHSPAFPWCFQRGLWPEWQCCKAQIWDWEGIKQWSRERKQPVAAAGLALRLGHNQNGSPLFFCSELCLSALWRSELSSGSSAQRLWFYLFFTENKPKHKAEDNSWQCPLLLVVCPWAGWSLRLGEAALGTQSQPLYAQLWDTGPFLLESQNFPQVGARGCSEI